MTDLKPAAELAASVSNPYPGDGADYRRARTALLAEEIELRRHIERVAEQRRAMPLGGKIPDLGQRTAGHAAPGPGSARRAGSDAAVEHPRPHARGARPRLVSGVRLIQRRRRPRAFARAAVSCF